MRTSSRITVLAQKLKRFFENNPLTIVIGVIVFLISATTTIINDGGDLLYKVNSSVGWRGFEENIINSLTASMSIEKFQETLGKHIFYRERENGYAEYVFERRDGRYWIQAITDNQGTVVLYTVTSCDDSFKPQIRYSPRERIIRLGESTFSEVGDNMGVIYHYFISGATSNSYLIEEAYLGNPGDYQTEFWGINDACDQGLIYDAYEQGLPEELIWNTDSQVDIEDPNLTQFRENFPINTYSISSPFADIDTIMQNFQIGVDRIQIRVVYPE